MKKYIWEIGLLITSIIWGSGFVATEIALDGNLTPLQIITIRFFIAAILVNLIFYKQIKQNISKEAIKIGAVLGLFLFIGFAAQTVGLMYTTPSKNAFITATNVVIVPFIGYILYKRKLDKFVMISSIITLIGIGILSLEANFTVNIGDFLTFLCAFGFAFHIFFTSELGKKYNAFVITGVQFSVAFMLSLILQIFMGEAQLNATTSGYLGVIYLAIFSTTIGFILQTICQKFIDGNKTVVILSTEAVFGAIFSIILLNEVVTSKLIIGSILIFIGIIISETKLSFLFKQKESSCEYVEDITENI